MCGLITIQEQLLKQAEVDKLFLLLKKHYNVKMARGIRGKMSFNERFKILFHSSFSAMKKFPIHKKL